MCRLRSAVKGELDEVRPMWLGLGGTPNSLETPADALFG